MEKQRFEDSLKDAFKGAEIEPSPAVWTNVELDLERASGDKMKRRLLFFQLLAAASMVFALGIGGVYYLQTSDVHLENTLANQANSKEQESNSTQLENAIIAESDEKIKLPAGAESYSNQSSGSRPSGKLHSLINENQPNQKLEQFEKYQQSKLYTATVTEGELRKQVSFIPNYSRTLPSLYNLNQPKLQLQQEIEADPGQLLLAKLEDEQRMLNKEDERSSMNEKIWASVGVGMGSYNPQGTSNTAARSVKPLGTSTSSSNPTGGASYSAGLNIAGKLSRRFVIQGGVSYLAQNAEYTSSSAVGQSASLNEFSADNNESIVTSPYKVDNNLKYLSVPVQAGFIVLDRSFGILLNGGIATDLFLQSTLTPSNDNFDKVTQGAGAESPYRTVNFSGLVGTEFSYKLADRYRIAVNPGLRYALNSLYKPEVDYQSSPMTFDVSLRFRYIFK